MGTPVVSVDEFQQLEQRILRAVELIRTEREGRVRAETELSTLREQMKQLETQVGQLTMELQTERARTEENAAKTSELNVEVAALRQEREKVKVRVDTMLQKLEGLL